MYANMGDLCYTDFHQKVPKYGGYPRIIIFRGKLTEFVTKSDTMVTIIGGLRY